jgi:uncharacterized membrane protein
MTIIAFIIYLPFVIVFLGYFLFLVIYGRPRGMLTQGGLAHANPQALVVVVGVSAVFLLLMLAAGVYALLMALRYSLSLAASVLEDLPARQAIRRSIELSKGSRARIFVLGLLISAIQVGLVAVTQVFFIIAAFKQHGQLPVWAEVLQQIVGFFTNTFIGPMYATGLTLFYYDQRVRKEGYDILWMMEAAGMAPPVLHNEALPAALPALAPDPSPESEP